MGALNLASSRRMPKPVGEPGGGMANAIVGTLILIGLAGVFAVPIGCIWGIHSPEYPETAFSSAVRFAADVLNGVPSIVIGIFAYGLVVLPFKRFNAIAGGVALGILMLPIVVRTTEELLRLVPGGLREGALALGATRSRAVFSVIVPAALPGILTGILVALARVAGETAPLLFTSFNNRFWSLNVGAADGITHRSGVHVRDLALRRLAPAGLGWSVPAGHDHPGTLDPGAAGRTAARTDESRMTRRTL